MDRITARHCHRSGGAEPASGGNRVCLPHGIGQPSRRRRNRGRQRASVLSRRPDFPSPSITTDEAICGRRRTFALGQHVRRCSAAVGASVDALIGHRQRPTCPSCRARPWEAGAWRRRNAAAPSLSRAIQGLPSRFDMDDVVRGIWNITMSRARMPFSTTATGYVSK